MTLLRQGFGGQAPECPHEQQVVNAVLAGSWPARCDESLVAHASTCATCKEVASVSVLLREDIDSSRIEVHVPAAGQVWWRAAVRARLESTQAAARPMGWMHAITAAIVLGVFLAVLTAVWPMVPGVLQTLRNASADFFPSTTVATAIAGGLAQTVAVGVAGALLLLLAPVALYFVFSRD
jgi:hypothetical protein